MITAYSTRKPLFKSVVISLLLMFFILDTSQLVFARREAGPVRAAGGPHIAPRHANPPGPAGGPGAGRHLGNPPGPVGGAGRGPAWRDNPRRIDNPPGPRGGRGTDWGNPPGPAGGPGRGPAWRDNPNKIDNPPGPVGGPGTDWKNPPGPKGGPGTNWGNPPGPAGGPGAGPEWKRIMAERRLERLAKFKERMATQGAPPEKIAKVDERMKNLETRIQERKGPQEKKN